MVPAHTLAQFPWLLGSSPLRITISPKTTAISVRNRATFILLGRVMLDKAGLEDLSVQLLARALVGVENRSPIQEILK